MRRFRDLPIRQKLMWVILSTSGLSLLLACAAFVVYELGTFRSRLVQKLETQADIVGYNTTSALVFEDAASAEQTLRALQAEESVREAAIYSAKGGRFASFRRHPDVAADLPERFADVVLGHAAGTVRLSRPLFSNTERVGTLVIVADLAELRSRIIRYVGIATLVFAVAIVAGLMISWRGQRLITRPVLDLAETARRVSARRDYSVRAHAAGSDEIGGLVEAFNQMLEQIQSRDSALEHARDEAEAGNRAKDEFLATVSHELRTPLSPILSWVTLLKSGRLDEEGRMRALDSIERNARSQAQLVEDLLDVSRIISGKLRLDVRQIDLSPLVDAAIDSVRPAAEAKGIRLEVIIDPRTGSVAADPERLQQIFWNLLSNAVKFTPRGGRVQMQLRRVNSHAELSVSDTGRGIPAEFLPLVFDRFRQADSSSRRVHGGLGIGLAIVRHLVELHGGQVRVESEGEDHGATFTVELPLSLTAASSRGAVFPAGRGEVPFEPSPILEGRRVLAVDDDRDTLDTLRQILSLCGAEVRTAASSAEALRVLDEWVPSLLISDIGMPVEDGYTLIRKVRERPPERGGRVPALALTAYARVEDRMKVFAAGYQMHVPKPVEPAELVAVIAGLSDWAERERVNRRA